MDPNLRQATEELAALFAEEEADKPQQILSHEALEERYQSEIEIEMAVFTKRVENGLTKIVEALRDQSMLTQDVIDAIRTLGDEPSNEIAEKLYQGAKWLFDQRQFDDAADAFVFLTSLKTDVYAFWLGLANAEYGRRHFKEALWAYARAADVNPGDPICHIVASKCHQELGDRDSAVQELDLALVAIQKNRGYSSWKPKLEQEKKRLENH